MLGKVWRKAVFGSIILSMLLFATLINPVLLSSTHAEEAELLLDVNIAPKLTLATSTELVEMTAIPDPNGYFTSNGMTAYITTNNITGYTLNISSKGQDSNLVNTVDNNTYLTSSFSGSVTSSTMTNNTWGYSVDNTNFNAVPLSANAATIGYSSSPTSQDSVAVYYGAKIDNTITPGVYEDEILLTAFVNSDIVPEAMRTIYDIIYMQDMSNRVCNNTTTPNSSATDLTWVKTDDQTKVPRTTLIDSRDGTVYLVSKLADGKCWMSQNLEFELDSDGVIAADSDLNTKSTWNPSNYTREWTDVSAWNEHEWDDDPGVNWEKSIKPAQSSRYLRGGVTPSSTASSNSPRKNWERTGYYYNWMAAGAGADIDDALLQDSICPKNWTLPTSSQYSTLISTYGLTSSPDLIKQDPLNFVYAGSIDDWDSTRSVSGLGTLAEYWVKDGAEGFYAHATSGNPRIASYYQENGVSVRCIAK